MQAEEKKADHQVIIALNRNLQDKVAEIELLQQTFTTISSELDLDRVFDIVVERACKLISAETLLIPLLDENCHTYTYRAGAGKYADEIIGESLPLDAGVCGWVWKHKKPWWKGVLNDLAENERNRWEKEVGSMVMVPLQGKKHFLGGIVGFNKLGGNDFDEKDLNLLQLFASIVSIAIENALVVKRIEVSHHLNENYRKRLEILNRQLVESSQELEFLSLYDSVTDLPNRSLFHDRLSQNLTRAKIAHQKIALLLIDLNSFKEINDVLGHDRGDLLLNKIARRFETIIQHNETLARLGGDEFVVILPDYNISTAVKLATRFTALLEKSFIIDNNEIIVSASIGLSIYPEHGVTISNLLSHADFAMYQAKDNHDSVAVYQAKSDYQARTRLTMVADIRKAMEEHEFELYYQPKCSLKTNEIVSAEALGRWHSGHHGMVQPAIFIDLMEQNKLIDAYTYWAIETALVQAKIWKQYYQVVQIAVNISPKTLLDSHFISQLKKIIQSKQDGELLCFEITENLFLSEFDRLASVLEQVRALGITLSIDDYGTGYSSLSRLRRLPVSELKIDQSFVSEMEKNQDDKVIVHSTIELAHNLGLNVVAEGVDTPEAYELLKNLGCDMVQGFYLGKPVPAKVFNQLLSLN